MGSCYSRQAQQQKYSLATSGDDHVNAIMPHPTRSDADEARAGVPAARKDKHPGFGFRMPHVGRHNNNNKQNRKGGQKKAGLQEQGHAATDAMSNGESEGRGVLQPLIKASGRRDKARGGNAAVGSQDNGLAASSDSLASTGSNGRAKGSRSLPSSKQSSLRRAYMPRSNTGSWRMIDDSSSAYSGRSGGDRPPEPNSRSSQVTVAARLSVDDLNNGNSTAGSTPLRTAAVVVGGAPLAVVESLETLSGGSREDGKAPGGGGGQTRSPATTNNGGKAAGGGGTGGRRGGTFQSRLRGPFRKYASAAGGSTGERSAKQAAAADGLDAGSRAGGSGGKWVKAKAEQSERAGKTAKGGGVSTGRRRLSGGEKPPPRQKTVQRGPPPRGAVTAKGDTNCADAEPVVIADGRESAAEKETSFVKPDPVPAAHREPSGRTPASSLDALETTSIGSIHSDDLMLDIDLDEYEELGSPPSAMEPSKHSRPRSRSRSRDNPSRRSSGAVVERSAEKCAGSKEKIESGITAPQAKLPCTEPLKELVALVQGGSTSTTTTQRRQQRRATRPASFPGPRADNPATGESGRAGGGGGGGGIILKPPRQGSVYASDEDAISIDPFTYRHLVQDVTSFKTMLLKLKRVIQEDEFHGQSCKNGFKLSSSQPTSPYDESNKYSFAAFLDQENYHQTNSNIEDVIKENADLKLQLQGFRHQVEEQERTIMLLQQQMTKYECGYSEPGGKAYSHASTQTDKQVSGFYKAGSYRSACVRRSSSTSSQPIGRYNYRNEFRGTNRSSITDEVFVGMESCDDDDLDLLMEEVSLGSGCLSSVGDSFSQCGERPLSSSSYHQRESSFSHSSSLTKRDHPYKHLQDSDSSHGERPHSCTIANVISHKVHPDISLKTSLIDSLDCAQQQNKKQLHNICEAEMTTGLDVAEGDEENVNPASPLKHVQLTVVKDVNSPLHTSNIQPLEQDDIGIHFHCQSPGGSSLSSSGQQCSLSGQSDYSMQSVEIGSSVPVKQQKSQSNEINPLPTEIHTCSPVQQLDLDSSGDQGTKGQVLVTNSAPQSTENNNTVLLSSETNGERSLNISHKHVLRKQDSFSMEETDPPPEHESQVKNVSRGLRLPSGRIKNWSNSRISSQSSLPPPRPLQPPAKVTSIKQDTDGSRFGLRTTSSGRILQLPMKNDVSEVKPASGLQKASVKKHRQLPNLASLRHSQGSRLPKGSSGDDIGVVRGIAQSKTQHGLRGQAK